MGGHRKQFDPETQDVATERCQTIFVCISHCTSHRQKGQLTGQTVQKIGYNGHLPMVVSR